MVKATHIGEARRETAARGKLYYLNDRHRLFCSILFLWRAAKAKKYVAEDRNPRLETKSEKLASKITSKAM